MSGGVEEGACESEDARNLFLKSEHKCEVSQLRCERENNQNSIDFEIFRSNVSF